MLTRGGLNPSASTFIPAREAAHSNTTYSYPEFFAEDPGPASANADSSGIVYTAVYRGLNYHQRLHAVNSALESRWSKPEPEPEPEPPRDPTATDPPEPESIGHPVKSVINGIPRGACRLRWLNEALGRSRSRGGSGVIVNGVVFSGEDRIEVTSVQEAPGPEVPHTGTSIECCHRYTDTFNSIEDGNEIAGQDEKEGQNEISGRDGTDERESKKSHGNGGDGSGNKGVGGGEEITVSSAEISRDVTEEDAKGEGNATKTTHDPHVKALAEKETPPKKAKTGDTTCPPTRVASGPTEVRSFPANALSPGAVSIPANPPLPMSNASTNVRPSGAASPQSRRRRRSASRPLKPVVVNELAGAMCPSTPSKATRAQRQKGKRSRPYEEPPRAQPTIPVDLPAPTKQNIPLVDGSEAAREAIPGQAILVNASPVKGSQKGKCCRNLKTIPEPSNGLAVANVTIVEEILTGKIPGLISWEGVSLSLTAGLVFLLVLVMADFYGSVSKGV